MGRNRDEERNKTYILVGPRTFTDILVLNGKPFVHTLDSSL